MKAAPAELQERKKCVSEEWRAEREIAQELRSLRINFLEANTFCPLKESIMAGIAHMKVQMTSGRNRSGCREVSLESCDTLKHLLPSPTAVIADQDGEEARREEGIETEQEAAEWRRGGVLEPLLCKSPSAQRPAEEGLPRNFHIPRKSKEQKALFQYLPPDSREFEDVVKILCTSYLEPSSTRTFSYAKVRLVHRELLEKDFCEKRKELKQEGRTDSELQESYGFLLTDSSKFQLPEICEKGLHVGHSRAGMLGNPALGVFLSRFSDLLQINPFEVGASGEIIIFKVMKGKVKNVFENKPKSPLDPSPGFDCHVSKKSSHVTSLLSYRAFEITQQYFYEYAFDDIKQRPRHVCPYAVVSFLYKGRQGVPSSQPTAPLRSIGSSSESSGGMTVRSRYTVWSGQLKNKGQLVSQVYLCSSSCAFLPFKLPEILDLDTAMHLDQVKRKIPSALFSLNTYSRMSEVVKSGLYCSLFDVEEMGKGSLMAVLLTLERDGMVLVKPLIDKGFLFLLSSAQMVAPNARSVNWARRLQVLFVFQESRRVMRLSSERMEGSLGSEVMRGLDSFIPALHYAQLKLRACNPPDLAAGVERQAHDYLCRSGQGKLRPYYLSEYKQYLDEREKLYPAPRHIYNLDGRLRAYLSRPGTYALPVDHAQHMVDSLTPPREHSSETDLVSAKGQAVVVKQAGIQGRGLPQGEFDPAVMKQLLKMIQKHKKTHDMEPGGEKEEAVTHGRGVKRKLKDKSTGTTDKCLQRSSDSSTAQVEEDKACRPPSPPEVITSIGRRDSDLRRRDSDLRRRDSDLRRQDSHLQRRDSDLRKRDSDLRRRDSDRQRRNSDLRRRDPSTQNLLKLLLTTLNQATTPASPTDPGDGLDSPKGGRRNGREPGTANHGNLLDFTDLGLPAGCDIDLRRRLKRDHQHKLRRKAGRVKHFSSDQPREESLMPWRLILITGLRTERFSPPEDLCPLDPRILQVPSNPAYACHGRPRQSLSEGADGKVKTEAVVDGSSCCSLDSVVDKELSSFLVDMQDVLRGEGVRYRNERPWPRPALHPLALSDYVSQHAPPAFAESFVSTLREAMNHVIGSQTAPTQCTTPLTNPSAAMPKKRPRQRLLPGGRVREGKDFCIRTDLLLNQLTAQSTQLAESSSVSDPAPASFSSPIGQMKPEMLSSVVKVIKGEKKNTDRFYIHPGNQDEGPGRHCQMKEYLKSLGNEECDPQTYLQSTSGSDKLLVIIENQDIAAHLHKVPALVSLKRLWKRVSFAGVDGLDDLKNHTYNELFVSGGFIVSDEFLLNPDFITYERLQALLTSLEGRSSRENVWRWKIHCKTQKKLKELGRCNNEALLLLNLLCSYQRRHLVEFLPYHECDTAARHAPNLPCLIHLQTQNTQHRHAIFLTERRVEMFPGYSSNGILVASIDDFMERFDNLVGTCDGTAESSHLDSCRLLGPPSVTVGQAEGMSLDPMAERFAVPLQNASQPALPPTDGLRPPLPATEEFRPPLPETEVLVPVPGVSVGSCSSGSGEGLDFEALKSTISQFKVSSHVTGQLQDLDLGVDSTFDPYQSFLSPGSLWTPPSWCLGPLAHSSSLTASSQERGYGSVPSHYNNLSGQQGSAQASCSTPAAPPPSSLGPAHLAGEGAVVLGISEQRANQN